VDSTAFANPHVTAPETKDIPEEPSGPPPEAFTNDRMAISPVPPPPKDLDERAKLFSKADYFYPYRQALSPRVGLIFGVRDSSDAKNIMNLLLGFNYLMPRPASPQYEVGADLSLGNLGFVNVTRRFIYNERGSFRPY